MSSELVVVLRCDYLDIVGAKAILCKELAVVKECATFIDYAEYTGKPYVALDYITPPGWYRVKGVSHYCPKHAEMKLKQKYSLPDFRSDSSINNACEEPTRKIRLPDDFKKPKK